MTQSLQISAEKRFIVCDLKSKALIQQRVKPMWWFLWKGHVVYLKTVMTWSPMQALLTQEHRTLSNINLFTPANDFCQLPRAYLTAWHQHSPTAQARNSGVTLHSFLSLHLCIKYATKPYRSILPLRLLWLPRTTLGQFSSCYFSPGLFQALLRVSLFPLVSAIFYSPHGAARVKLWKCKLDYFTPRLKTLPWFPLPRRIKSRHFS